MVICAFVAITLGCKALPFSIEQTSEKLVVELEAADYKSESGIWRNRALVGDFKAVGAPKTAELGGQHAVLLDGKNDAFIGPVAPSNLLGSSPRSIEVWAYNPGIDSPEETMVSWGRRGGPDLTAFSFNYGNSPMFGAATHWAGDLGWKEMLRAGKWHHLVYTYDGTAARVYDNGVMQGVRVLKLNTAASCPIMIGVQTGADGKPQFLNVDGTSLAGSLALAKVRIYTSALSGAQIQSNFSKDADLFGAKPPLDFKKAVKNSLAIHGKELSLNVIQETGTVASLGPKSLSYDFTPGDRLIGRLSGNYHHLGDITFRTRTIGGTWQTFSTVANPLEALTTRTSNGLSIDLTRTVKGDSPLRIARKWSIDKGQLVLGIELENLTKGKIEIGALGVAMPFNNDFEGRSLAETHEKCSFSDPYIGGDAGFIQVVRVNGAGPALLVLPEKDTPFEAYRPIREDPVPLGVTHEGKYEWVIHSKAYCENEWKNAKPWNQPTSRMLAPRETATYGYRFVLSPSIDKIETTLIANRRPVIVAVPGYVVPKDNPCKLLLHSASPVKRISIAPQQNASAKLSAKPTKNGWREIAVKARLTGPYRICITYEDGSSQFVHMNAIDSARDQVRKLARFHQNKQWYADPGDPFKRTYSYMFWDRQAGMLLQESRTWNVGLSDECGAGPNLLMAMQNLMDPDQAQVRQLEQYVDHALWGNLQSRTDYGIKASLFYYQPDLLSKSFYTVPGGWDKVRSETTWRAYNYPHQAAIYWSLYRLARFTEGLVIRHDWKWYLKQAYRTGLALQDHCGPSAFLNLAQFGLMDGSVFVEILRDLKREGWTSEASEYEAYMLSRAKIWQAKSYPFGSEMPWDSTGQEEVYAWCRYFGFKERAKETVSAVASYTPVVPNWAYCGSSRRYFDSMVYGKFQGIARGCLHYGASLNAIPLLDSFRASVSGFRALQAGYAGATGVLANVNSEGHGSMLFCADPAVLDWEPYSGDYGCAFYGFAFNSGAYVVKHSEFGWLGFGCAISRQGNLIKVVPNDAYRRRVFFAPFNLWISVISGSIESAAMDVKIGKLTIRLAGKTAAIPKSYLSVVNTIDGKVLKPSKGGKTENGLVVAELAANGAIVEFETGTKRISQN